MLECLPQQTAANQIHIRTEPAKIHIVMGSDPCHCKNVCIKEGIFGEIGGDAGGDSSDTDGASTKIKCYKMSNSCGVEVMVMTLGATIISIKCPDKYGDRADIVLGFDNLDSYLDPRLNRSMGCIIGRCSGHSEKPAPEPKLTCGGDSTAKPDEDQKLDVIQSCNCLGRRIWESCIEDDCRVVMTYLSPDGEDGYSGALLLTVKFELKARGNSLEISMRAVSSKQTMVNLSHGSVFNLAGHGTGSDALRDHEISLNCDQWIEEQPQMVDNESTTTESLDYIDVIRPVGGTRMDLRFPQTLGQVIDKLFADGCQKQQHYYTITKGSSLQPEVSFVSRILHRKSGRFLEVYSDQPGVEFCSGGQLPPYCPSLRHDCCKLSTTSSQKNEEEREQSSNNSSNECLNIADCDCKTESSISNVGQQLEFLPGKCGAKYKRFGGFSLLPQNRPTATKISLIPSATLRPGQVYYHDLVYKFGVDLESC